MDKTSNPNDVECRPVLANENGKKVSDNKPSGDKSATVTDGGYGYVVIIAAFCCGWIIGVMFIAFSILYTEFWYHFNSGYSTIGWVGSLYLATGNILGKVFIVMVF